MSADSSSKFRQIIFPILIGIFVEHLVELCVAFWWNFLVAFGVESDRHGCHGFHADRDHRIRRVGLDCQADRVYFRRRELSLFMFLEFMVRSTLSYQKSKNFIKILPRLNFWTRFQIFGRHELFSVFFLNRIEKISYARNCLAWISFRFSKKSWVKN